MRQIKGMWFPDEEHGAWIDRLTEEDGMPIYQPDAFHALVEAAETRKVAVDGGAHVGLWTIHLARFFDVVYAFEPNPTAFACLERNVEQYGCWDKVVLKRSALGRRPGEITLRGSDEKSLSWSARARTLTEQERLETKAVKMTCVDVEIYEPVSAIKLDVEGFQFEALLGAARTLLAFRPVVLMEEKHDDPQWRASKLLQQIGMYNHGRWKRDFLFTWNPPLPGAV